jgi:hypothetical protein
MDVTERSTSPMMKQIFGKDLGIILSEYNSRIEEVASRNSHLRDVFSDCVNRTGFIFPYMSTEYGYHCIKGCFMPSHMKRIVTGFGLIGLAISVDDDIADEYAGNHLKMVRNISVSELIQNLAYQIIFSNSGLVESGMVLAEIGEAVSSTANYQCADALNILNFQKEGFDLEGYLYAAKKTVCPIKHGLRLGMALAGGQQFEGIADAVGERLGIALQLIDDIVDLEEDMKNYKGTVTLPMFLLHNNKPFEKILDIIDDSINECLVDVKKLPFSSKLEQMIGGFLKIEKAAKKRLLCTWSNPETVRLFAGRIIYPESSLKLIKS